MMELKSLWLGMVISMAAFSVKTGLGWGYLWLKLPRRRRAAVSLALLAAYGALFAAVFLLVSKVDLLAHIDIFLPLFSGGVTIHWLIALLLFCWGLYLLKSGRDDCCGESRTSKGVLALVIPCPVCMSAILMAASGAAMYFPDDAARAIAGLFAAFAAISAASGTAMIWGGFGKKQGREDGGELESDLGFGMMMIAAYFIISALVMPQFAEVDRIYRLAAYSGEGVKHDAAAEALTFGVIFALIAAGFLLTAVRLQKLKRTQKLNINSNARIGEVTNS
jgi:predicted transporter